MSSVTPQLPGFKLKIVAPNHMEINSVSQSETAQISEISIINQSGQGVFASTQQAKGAPVPQVGQGIADYVSSESDIQFDPTITFSESDADSL